MKFDSLKRQGYYQDAEVRARLGDFLGGSLSAKGDAVFFAHGTESDSHYREQYSAGILEQWLAEGAELDRSLWDKQGLLGHLDIEYVNFDRPLEAYLSPQRAFHLQQPVRETVMRVLCRYGIKPLQVVTGRGYHFVWRVNYGSRAFEQMAALGRMSDSLARLYATTPAPDGDCVSADLGKAYSGLGMVMEFLVHQIKREAAPHTEVPIEAGAIEVGPSEHGREMISLDITEYSDPLIARSVRAPFSVYLKPWQQPWLAHGTELEDMGPIVCIPGEGLDDAQALRIRGDVEAVKDLARHSSTVIPDFSSAHEFLINGYEASPLREFHQWYYSVEHDPVESWPQTYDRTDLQVLPNCVRQTLESPNDALLRPGWVRRLTRVMLALGWHPRHIAGLLRSKYERDHGWGDQWYHCDPATRADFYARVFSGLFLMRVDGLVDFNCQSAREEGLCGVPDCTGNLAIYRQSLIERKRYERLADRPLHGLFFPESHP